MLALTMGDPAGIGGEIAVKAWQALRQAGPRFMMLDDPARLAAFGVPVRIVASAAEARDAFADALPVLPVPLGCAAIPGQPDARNAGAVIGSIERAVRLVQDGQARAVVTNPIAKHVLYAAGFQHPGHTEFLGALTGAALPVMMLANRFLRVVPVTVHVSLREALARLDTRLIVEHGRIVADSLRRSGIASPRLGVAGLNPHAGEGGAMGSEETDIILPAIQALRAEGIAVTGPYPPDTMFTPEARAGYDAALCMYHDQALIPLKTLDMASGVNITLGLPIVRTSPDHGTAFDIAGQGLADASSLIAALRMADEMTR
ncbi:MAG: 4-hydroxythreonine-4-phosphate dehydrogenase PdxA [Janthinobacterium lividum]